MQFKNISDSVIDVDDKSRTVKVAISEVGSKDLDNEVVDSGAYTKTIAERGPSGANLIWHLTDHNPSLKSAVGKFKALGMSGNKLVGETNIPNTQWGSDVLEMYKSGIINQHSIGFRVVQSEMKDEGSDNEYRVIKEVKLYEGSAVLWGANPNTPTISVGKSISKEDAEKTVASWERELDLIAKALRSGANFTDETFELMELRTISLKDQIRTMFLTLTTQAEVKTSPKPETDAEFIQELKFLKHLISTQCQI